MAETSSRNALQRLYFGWAEKRYARMQPALAAESRRIDEWLYSRAAIGLWLGLLSAFVASIAGLRAGGFPWPLAIGSALIVWIGLPAVALGAWLQPQKFSARRLWRNALTIGGLAYAGAFCGFLVGRIVRYGGLHTETLADALWKAATASLPLLLVLLGAMLGLLGGVAQIRAWRDRRELERLTLVQDRDAAARRAAEARLQLLQAQIQPHFIFNTLAALQHWVDVGDPRAPALLRTLTAFLRGSTELLGRDTVTVGEEFEATGQYLQIMQARLGDRLRTELRLDPACADRPLPPGLLLTLVENAVEHGISPSLGGGTVQVAVDGDAHGTTIRVRDDGVGLAPQWRDGTGLANCRERLRHHGDGQGALDLHALDRGTEAVLRLPREA